MHAYFSAYTSLVGVKNDIEHIYESYFSNPQQLPKMFTTACICLHTVFRSPKSTQVQENVWIHTLHGWQCTMPYKATHFNVPSIFKH